VKEDTGRRDIAWSFLGQGGAFSFISLRFLPKSTAYILPLRLRPPLPLCPLGPAGPSPRVGGSQAEGCRRCREEAVKHDLHGGSRTTGTWSAT
jgi:hypothetical protein